MLPNGVNENNKDNLSVYIRCLDTKQDIFLHLSSKIVLFIKTKESPISNGGIYYLLKIQKNNIYKYYLYIIVILNKIL